MILTGLGPMPFNANIHLVATLTVTWDANRRTEVERFGTELAAIESERLASARHRGLLHRASNYCQPLRTPDWEPSLIH